MIYLVIFVVVAAGGIGSLWFYQRRERKQLNSVDSFCASLERISTQQLVSPAHIESGPSQVRPGGSRRPEPLDPARREAARRRLERRRAARV